MNYTKNDERHIEAICKDLVTRKSIPVGEYWLLAVIAFCSQNKLHVNCEYTGYNYLVTLV